MFLSEEQAFFDYINEREQIRLRKEADLPFPWTDDVILRTFKFTNVKRHHDKTSRKLREKFYGPHFHDDPKTILMNCATFRYFGTYEFAEVIGWTDYNLMDDNHWEKVKQLASDRLKNRERVFTGAYIITNQGISAPKQEVVVDYFLKGLQANTPAIVNHADISGYWEETAHLMRQVTGFGGTGFMTKEVLLDTTYTGFWRNIHEHPKDGTFSYPKDWETWTPIGPGALRGASRVAGNTTPLAMKATAAFEMIMELHGDQHLYLDGELDLNLVPTDIQFALCEFDKYERVRLGQGRPRSLYHA